MFKQGRMMEVFKITQYFSALCVSISLDSHVMCEVFKRSAKSHLSQKILLPVIRLPTKSWNYSY
jgi:hypothetical protein